MIMVDTHCHLDIDEYENVEEVIKNMGNNIMIASGYNNKSNKRVLELINKYENIYGTIGIHPNEFESMNDESIKYIEDNLNNKKIVGIGEIGLDYNWDTENKELQKEYFIKQILLAKKYNKVIVIHSRDACMDTYNILKENLDNIKAVMHCYSYSKEMALEFKKIGLKFGIGGVVTFKNSSKLQEVVKSLNLEDILLETDSPYLSPEPLRGKKNEPKNVYLVAQKIAELKGASVDEIIRNTTNNAASVFDLNM